MQHSIKNIGREHQQISTLRGDKKLFNADDFFQFAKSNQEVYHIVEAGEDLLVSTWFSNELIADYIKTLNN